MLISVTQQDIENGVDCDTQCCPIALAIYRVAGQCTVGKHSVEFASGGRVPLPWCAQQFIRDFDHERDVEPFEFELS